MAMFKNIFSIVGNPTKFFLVIALLLAIVILGSVLLIPAKKPPQKQPILQIEPSTLTPQERIYREAAPQPFPSPAATQSSTLIVTSNPDGVRVMIDPPEEEASGTSTEIPVNITPFKITTIPVGEHTLTAFKKGYNLYSTKFTISADKVTRLDIDLKPLEDKVGY